MKEPVPDSPVPNQEDSLGFFQRLKEGPRRIKENHHLKVVSLYTAFSAFLIFLLLVSLAPQIGQRLGLLSLRKEGQRIFAQTSCPVGTVNVTQPFGEYDPEYYLDFHPGVDLGGKQEVCAVVPGCIEYSGWADNSLGNIIVERGRDGFYYRFVHLADGSLKVSIGSQIAKGELLAISDNTGFSDGDHLHLDMADSNLATILYDPGSYIESIPQSPNGSSIPVNRYVNVSVYSLYPGATGTPSCTLPNQAPFLSPIGNKTVFVGITLTFEVSATDPDGDPVILSAQSLPVGATFVSPTFSWKPTAAQLGDHQVTFVASDGSLTDTETIVITVREIFDTDGDGFKDVTEKYLGTDPTKKCPTTATADDEVVDAWPPDFNDNRVIQIDDVNAISARFNRAAEGTNRRYDLNGDGWIRVDDVYLVSSRFGQSCIP